MDKSVKFLNFFKHFLCSLCSIVNKILARVIWKSLFSFYSNLKKPPNISRIWVVIISLSRGSRCVILQWRVRKEAMMGLAQIYKKYALQAEAGKEAAKQISWIKDKLLHIYYQNSIDDRWVKLISRLSFNTCYILGYFKFKLYIWSINWVSSESCFQSVHRH